MSVRLILIFRLVISSVFIFSTIAKLLSLPFFDGMVAELFLGKDYYNHPDAMFWCQLFTRVLIAGEFLLGVAILQQRYLKNIILPAILIMLVGFTFHLFYAATVLEKGFIGGNCGCFGDLVPMDNFESILKNILSMAMVAYIYKYVNPRRDRINSLIMVFTVGIITFITLLLTIKDYEIKNEVTVFDNQLEVKKHETITRDTHDVVEVSDSNSRVNLEVTQVYNKDDQKENTSNEVEKEKPLTKPKEKITIAQPKRLLDNYTQFSNGIDVNLYEGEKIVCMFSVTCGHCQETYKDICGYASSGKLPEVYLLNYGSELDQNYFFSQSGCKHPHILLNDYTKFQRLLEGNDFPRVLHLKDGEVVGDWNLDTYSKKSFSLHFSIEEKKKEDNGLELNFDNGGEGSSLFGDY